MNLARAALLLLTVALLALLWVRQAPADPALVAAAYGAEQALPEPYVELREALEQGDHAALERLAHADDSYRAYLAAMGLARAGTLEPAARLAALERGLALRMHDSLKRAENLELELLRAELAAAAGDDAKALDAYRGALPDARAVEPFAALEQDPYRRAAAFQSAGLQSRALEALDGRAAPSIEAPALRALGRYEEALDAYRRWLTEQPGNATALLGEAWCLFYLGRDAEATAAFTALGADGNYGLGLLANRAGEIDRAVDHLARTGRADLIWLSTGLLEARDRYADALPHYLTLARGASTYADDAGYRAFVLASRLGDAAAAEEARALLPEGSFFAMKLGGAPAVPDPLTAEVGELSEAALDAEATERTAAVAPYALSLHAAGEADAAVGELLFALREAEAAGDVAAVLEFGELLQSFDEYRQSVRAARELLSAGVNDLRAWRLAYPPAWPLSVTEEAALNQIEPALIWAVMRQESAYSPVAISRSNAQGLMQVVPTTWDWIAELREEEPGDPFDVDSNVAYGATYLAWLMRYFDGDEELVIASYNGGQGYVGRLFDSEWVAGDKDEFYREIDRSETREYLQRVSENLAVYRVLYPGLAQGEMASLE